MAQKQTSTDVSSLAGKWLQRAQGWGGMSCYRYIAKEDVDELIRICASCLSQDEENDGGDPDPTPTATEVAMAKKKPGRPKGSAGKRK
jgi:hypothetical protein